MNEYCEDFKTYLEEQDYATITIRGYVSATNSFLSWYQQTNGEDAPVSNVVKLEIQEYREFLSRSRRVKAGTVNFHLSALNSFFSWAQLQQHIAHNPASGVKTIKVVDPGPKYLTRTQQNALYRALEVEMKIAELRQGKRKLTRIRDICMVLFLLNTGLRIGELIELQMDDITLTKRKGSVLVRNGKGNKQRLVPLNQNARRAMETWMEIHKEFETPYVWISLENDSHLPLGTRSIQNIVRRIGKEADLPSLTPHTLRHTFAKNLADSSQGIEKISLLLGHADLNTTKRYILPNASDLEKTVTAIETDLDHIL